MFRFSSELTHLILQTHGLYVFDKFSRKKTKFLPVGWAPPMLHEMRGRHGLMLLSATPLRHARNQSILGHPFETSPTALLVHPINLAGCSLPGGTVLVAEAAGAVQRGGLEQRYRRAGA